MACITEGAIGYPGGNAHIPPECGTLAEVMRRRGWSTFWLGKNHSVPVDDLHAGSDEGDWPLHQGFDRFYGFLGGETNQWYPDAHRRQPHDRAAVHAGGGLPPLEGPRRPGDQMIRDVRRARRRGRGSCGSAPARTTRRTTCRQEWADKYKGQFDDGYEAYREWVLPRMIEKGILPEGTELTPMNPMPDGTYSPLDDVRPWDSLSADEKRLFSRMAEVFAGFSEYTDHQVGRIVDYLEESGQLDNTIILYCADNGASGEGSPNGSVNENKFFNGWPDDMEENLKHLDDLGSPDTYNHYPTGWAMAFSTPFRMFKRYSYQGGVCDPMVIHWPKGIAAKGEVRHQYHHAIDIVPTILECCGLEFPATLNGHDQVPLPGVSMRYSFDAADAPTTAAPVLRDARHARHLGGRLEGRGRPRADVGHRPLRRGRWQLFHTDDDRSEAHDLAEQEPERLKELIDAWFEEAEKFNVLPLDDRHPPRSSPIRGRSPSRTATRSSTTRTPPTCPSRWRPTRSRSFKILAEVEVDERGRGGRDLRPRLPLRRPRAVRQGPEALVRLQLPRHPARAALRLGGARAGQHVLGMEFVKEGSASTARRTGRRSCTSTTRRSPRGRCARSGQFTLCGDGLCVGRDSGDAVSSEYTSPAASRGAHIPGRGQCRRRPVRRPREGCRRDARSRVAAMTSNG